MWEGCDITGGGGVTELGWEGVAEAMIIDKIRERGVTWGKEGGRDSGGDDVVVSIDLTKDEIEEAITINGIRERQRSDRERSRGSRHEMEIKERGSLVNPCSFMNTPLVFNSNLYAYGNDIYVHQYNIPEQKWSVIPKSGVVLPKS